MRLGVVFPHNEIGVDPAAIRNYAQGAEALGADHILTYDHVLDADPDRPDGWNGPYDKDVAFHEPFTLFSFMASSHRHALRRPWHRCGCPPEVRRAVLPSGAGVTSTGSLPARPRWWREDARPGIRGDRQPRRSRQHPA